MKRNTLLYVVIFVIVLGAGGIYASIFSSQTTPPVVQENPPSIDQTPKETPPAQTPPAAKTPVDPNLPTPSSPILANCTTDMATQFHIHQHLVILVNKEPQTIAANIGIDVPTNCMSSIHTHAAGGIIHVESPVKADFLLGDVFYNWKKPLSKDRVGEYKIDMTHGLKMYVNGKESNDFEKLILQDHQEITLVYYDLKEGPGTLPPPFNWQGF